MDAIAKLRAKRLANKELAQKLHSGLVQSLATISMRAGLSRRMLEKDSELAVQEISKLEQLSRKVVAEARYLLFTLDPSIIEISGLQACLLEWAPLFEAYTGIKIDLQMSDNYQNEIELDFLTFSLTHTLTEEIARNTDEEISLAFSSTESKERKIRIEFSGQASPKDIPEYIAIYGGEFKESNGANGNSVWQISLPAQLTSNTE